MTIRSRLTFSFGIILLLAVIPLTVFTLRVAPFNFRLVENKNFEHSLESAITHAENQEEKMIAMDALREYRQVAAVGKPIKEEFIKFSIILTCVLFFAAMTIISLSVEHITKPLKELTTATHKIASGDTSVHLKEGRSKEFNVLINAFNRMTYALSEARHKLKLAERHTAWREMARMLAHEIKNPLTPIQLSTQRLREKHLQKSQDLPEVIDKTTKIISQEVDNFVRLVDKFSEFAHFPSPSLELVSINSIVHDSVALYANLPDVKFEESYDDIPSIMADPGQIKQALSNIIKNATESRDGKCVIKVTTKALPTEVEIFVADNGKGLSQEDLERLFHPYFTTKEQGSGLGLVITERIITEHSGEISVDSKEGSGTTVSIKLPLTPSTKIISQKHRSKETPKSKNELNS